MEGLEFLPLRDALSGVEHKRNLLEAAQEAAEEALTQWFEFHLQELAKRFPRRCFRADSGMGSLSVGISPGPAPDYRHHTRGEYVWIWGNDDWSPNPVLDPLFKHWTAILNEVSKRAGLEYVNFTRDIIVKGERYTGE